MEHNTMKKYLNGKITSFVSDIHGKIPVLLIENFYDENELKLIWRELNFLTSREKLYDPEDTATAKNPDGTSKKKNKGIFLDAVYSDRNVSDILRINRKIFDIDLMEEFIKVNPIFRAIGTSTQDTTLISYYENEGKYDTHTDIATLTGMTYFFKEPKKFTGGNLIFPDYDLTIEVQNNLFVLFPSCLLHEVSEVKTQEEEFNGMGRYSMSQFITHITPNQ